MPTVFTFIIKHTVGDLIKMFKDNVINCLKYDKLIISDNRFLPPDQTVLSIIDIWRFGEYDFTFKDDLQLKNECQLNSSYLEKVVLKTADNKSVLTPDPMSIYEIVQFIEGDHENQLVTKHKKNKKRTSKNASKA